jgi:hypothetical protein
MARVAPARRRQAQPTASQRVERSAERFETKTRFALAGVAPEPTHGSTLVIVRLAPTDQPEDPRGVVELGRRARADQLSHAIQVAVVDRRQ